MGVFHNQADASALPKWVENLLQVKSCAGRGKIVGLGAMTAVVGMQDNDRLHSI